MSYWLIALTGQLDTHAPHSTHVSSLTTALPPSMEIAETGQEPSHAPQPMHVPPSTFAFAIAITSSLVVIV